MAGSNPFAGIGSDDAATQSAAPAKAKSSNPFADIGTDEGYMKPGKTVDYGNGATGQAGESDGAPKNPNGPAPEVYTAGKRDFGDRPVYNTYNPGAHGMSWNAMDEITSGMIAPVDSAINYLTGKGPTSLSENYDQAQAEYLRNKALYEEQNPTISAGAELVGNIVSGGGGLAPAKNAGWAYNTLRSGFTGAVAGAGQGAAAANEQGVSRLDGAADGAAWGAGAGFGVPIVAGAAGLTARGIGAGARKVRDTKNFFLNPEQLAQDKFVRAAAKDRATFTRDAAKANARGEGVPPPRYMDEEDLLAAEASGQRTNVGDLGGDNARATVKTATVASPEAADEILSEARARQAGMSTRAARTVTDMFDGPGVNPVEVIDDLKARAQAENKANYDASYSHPAASDIWNEKLRRMTGSRAVQSAMKKAAEDMAEESVNAGGLRSAPKFSYNDGDGLLDYIKPVRGDGTTAAIPGDPNLRMQGASLEFWDRVKRNLDDQVEGAKGPNGKWTNEAQRLNSFKKQLLAHLDDATIDENGESLFKKARSTAKEYFDAEDAHDAGMKYFTNQNAYNTAATRAALDNMTPSERELFARGYAASYLHKLSTLGEERDVNRLLKNENARMKLVDALGPDRAAKVEAHAIRSGVQRLMGETVQRGSDTARNQYMMRQLTGELGFGLGAAGAESYLSGGMSGQTLLTAVLFGAARKGGRKISEAQMQKYAKAMSELVTNDDPEVIAKIYTRIQRDPELARIARDVAAKGLTVGARTYGVQQSGTQNYRDGGSVRSVDRPNGNPRGGEPFGASGRTGGEGRVSPTKNPSGALRYSQPGGTMGKLPTTTSTGGSTLAPKAQRAGGGEPQPTYKGAGGEAHSTHRGSGVEPGITYKASKSAGSGSFDKGGNPSSISRIAKVKAPTGGIMSASSSPQGKEKFTPAPLRNDVPDYPMLDPSLMAQLPPALADLVRRIMAEQRRINMAKKPKQTSPKMFAEGGHVQKYANAGRVVKEAVEGFVGTGKKAAPKEGAELIEDWKWRPEREVADELGLQDQEIPDHVQAFGQYMKEMSDKAGGKGLSKRDMIKAYTITRSSIQRRAQKADKLRAGGFDIPGAEGSVRPEGAMAEWLFTPAGQRYLDNAEKGIVDEDAIVDLQAKFKPFGKADKDVPDFMRSAVVTFDDDYVKQLSDLVARGARGESHPDEWRKATARLRGIGPAKKGFIASMLGRGDQPTPDARQLVLQTGRPSKEASGFMARRGGRGGDAAVERLAERQRNLNMKLPAELDPYYQHLTHHTIWDKVAGEKTTHADIIRAMRLAAQAGAIPAGALAMYEKNLGEGQQFSKGGIVKATFAEMMKLAGITDAKQIKEIAKSYNGFVSKDPGSWSYEAVDNTADHLLPKRHVDIADLQGKLLTQMTGDKSNGALSVLRVNGNDVGGVGLQAGSKFARRTGDANPDRSVWASHENVVDGYEKRIRAADQGFDYFPELYGPGSKAQGELVGVFNPMGDAAVDFSTMPTELAWPILKQLNLDEASAREVDDLIRRYDYDKKKPKQKASDWVGINSDAAFDQLMGRYQRDGQTNSPANLRKALLSAMSNSTLVKKHGLPEAGQFRFASTDPDLLLTKEGMMGNAVVKFDPKRARITDPAYDHRSYAQHVGGDYLGGFEVPVPRQMLMRDWHKNYELTKAKAQRAKGIKEDKVQGGMRNSFVYSDNVMQKVDQQLVDEVSAYIEAMKRNRDGR